MDEITIPAVYEDHASSNKGEKLIFTFEPSDIPAEVCGKLMQGRGARVMLTIEPRIEATESERHAEAPDQMTIDQAITAAGEPAPTVKPVDEEIERVPVGDETSPGPEKQEAPPWYEEIGIGDLVVRVESGNRFRLVPNPYENDTRSFAVQMLGDDGAPTGRAVPASREFLAEEFLPAGHEIEPDGLPGDFDTQVDPSTITAAASAEDASAVPVDDGASPEPADFASSLGHGSIVKHRQAPTQYIVCELDTESADGLFDLQSSRSASQHIRISRTVMNEHYENAPAGHEMPPSTRMEAPPEDTGELQPQAEEVAPDRLSARAQLGMRVREPDGKKRDGFVNHVTRQRLETGGEESTMIGVFWGGYIRTKWYTDGEFDRFEEIVGSKDEVAAPTGQAPTPDPEGEPDASAPPSAKTLPSAVACPRLQLQHKHTRDRIELTMVNLSRQSVKYVTISEDRPRLYGETSFRLLDQFYELVECDPAMAETTGPGPFESEE